MAEVQTGFPVVYELNEDNQATGIVYRFCNDTCANRFRMESLDALDQFPRYSWGRDMYCNTDEICMQCGQVLEEAHTKELSCHGKM